MTYYTIKIENLYWGTHAMNMQDKTKNGTQNTGERHGMSKLTKQLVIELRKLYRIHKVSQWALAKKFNISQSAVSLVITKKRWSHV